MEYQPDPRFARGGRPLLGPTHAFARSATEAGTCTAASSLGFMTATQRSKNRRNSSASAWSDDGRLLAELANVSAGGPTPCSSNQAERIFRTFVLMNWFHGFRRSIGNPSV